MNLAVADLLFVFITPLYFVQNWHTFWGGLPMCFANKGIFVIIFFIIIINYISLLRWMQFFFQAVRGLRKELLPLAEGFILIINKNKLFIRWVYNIKLNKYKAFCQCMQFFSKASDGLEKELHPSEECGAETVYLNIQLYIPIKLRIPPMDAIVFPGRLRTGKRIASIGRRLLSSIPS